MHSMKWDKGTGQCDGLHGHICTAASRRPSCECSRDWPNLLHWCKFTSGILSRSPYNYHNSSKFSPKKGNLKGTNSSKKSSPILRAHLVNCITAEDRTHCYPGTPKKSRKGLDLLRPTNSEEEITWSRSSLFLPASLPVGWGIYSSDHIWDH